MKDIIILLGPPASGKGTQSALLSKKFDYAAISTGSLLRREVEKGSSFGKEIADLRTAKNNSEYNLNNKIMDLANEKNKLDKNLKDANKNIDDLTKQKDKAETDLKNINTKLDKLKKDYDTLKNSGNIDEQLKSQLDTKEKEIDSLTEYKNKAEADLKEKNDEIAKLKNNEKNLQNQLDAQKKLNDLIGKGDSSGQVKNLTEAVKKLKDDIDQKQKLIDEKDKKIQELSAGSGSSGGKPPQPEEKSDEFEEMKKKIKELEDKNKKLEEENNKLKENKADAKELVERVKRSAPSKAGNVVLVTASGLGTAVSAAGISASFFLKSCIMFPILEIGVPGLFIIICGICLGFGIHNLINAGNMKKPLKTLSDRLKKPNSKEIKYNSEEKSKSQK